MHCPLIEGRPETILKPIIRFKDHPDTDRWARYQAALDYQTTPKIAPINFAIPDEPYRQ